MGQRTAILVKKNYADGHSEINLIHHQWGIGTVLPSILMQEVLKAYYPLDRKNMFNRTFEDVFTFEPLSNEQDNYIYNKEGSLASVWDKETVMKLFNDTENNNGGLIVEVTNENEGMFISAKSVKIGFVLGWEECCKNKGKQGFVQVEEEFSRIVTAKEFMKKTANISYSAPFNACFDKFCKTFEIEQVKEFKS